MVYLSTSQNVGLKILQKGSKGHFLREIPSETNPRRQISGSTPLVVATELLGGQGHARQHQGDVQQNHHLGAVMIHIHMIHQTLQRPLGSFLKVKSQVGPPQHWPVGPARIPVDRFRSGSWSYQQKSEAVLASHRPRQRGQGSVAICIICSELARHLTSDSPSLLSQWHSHIRTQARVVATGPRFHNSCCAR